MVVGFTVIYIHNFVNDFIITFETLVHTNKTNVLSTTKHLEKSKPEIIYSRGLKMKIISGCWNRYPSPSIVMVCMHAPTNKQSGCHKGVINTPRTYSFTRTHAYTLSLSHHTHTHTHARILYPNSLRLSWFVDLSVTDSCDHSNLHDLPM
jgi:hypothetical protein